MNADEQRYLIDLISNTYEVKRNTNETCEMEVTAKAMCFYLNYPEYKKTRLVNTSVATGAYCIETPVLCTSDKIRWNLTADILTSIKTIWNSFSGKTSKLDGTRIKEKILNNKEFLEKSPEYLWCYLKTFAFVYYWCGNMMPFIANDSYGTYADNMIYKLSIIQNLFNNTGCNGVSNTSEDVHDEIINWINLKQTIDSSSFVNFVRNNYLDDIIDDNRELKIIISYKQNINSLSPANIKILSENDFLLGKEWILNNIKIIIQRSYRIVHCLSGDWEKPENLIHKKNVIKTMYTVFDFTGLSSVLGLKTEEDLELF